MLHDFSFYNPTKIHFGKSAMEHLPSELSCYGQNVLLLYGKVSIKKIGLYDKVIKILKDCNKNITVAIMGCVVNGPGEAREADIGIAGGDNCGVLFKNGEIIKKVPESALLDELLAEIEKL